MANGDTVEPLVRIHELSEDIPIEGRCVDLGDEGNSMDDGLPITIVNFVEGQVSLCLAVEAPATMTGQAKGVFAGGCTQPRCVREMWKDLGKIQEVPCHVLT